MRNYLWMSNLKGVIMGNYPAAHLLFSLVFVVLAEVLTYTQNPRRSLKRAILGIVVLTIFAIFTGNVSAATSESRSYKTIGLCAMVSIGQLIPYTIACIVLLVVIFCLLRIDKLVLRLHTRLSIFLAFVLPPVLLFGNTALCYRFVE
jgi:hypothetical protein